MSFQYNVVSEEEAQKAREFPLLPDGTYDFYTMESKFQQSSTGNPMIALKVKIMHDGKDFNVFDNLIGIASMDWKTKHYCETTGLQQNYIDKTFDEKVAAGRKGKCIISTQPAKPKNDGSGTFYKAKNVIDDYVTADTLAKTEGQGAEFFEDSLPF